MTESDNPVAEHPILVALRLASETPGTSRHRRSVRAAARAALALAEKGEVWWRYSGVGGCWWYQSRFGYARRVLVIPCPEPPEKPA